MKPTFTGKGNADPLPSGMRSEETHKEEYFTIFETQVLTDLLVVTGMSEVKDTVPC